MTCFCCVLKFCGCTAAACSYMHTDYYFQVYSCHRLRHCMLGHVHSTLDWGISRGSYGIPKKQPNEIRTTPQYFYRYHLLTFSHTHTHTHATIPYMPLVVCRLETSECGLNMLAVRNLDRKMRLVTFAPQ